MPSQGERQLGEVGETGILEVIERIAATDDPSVIVGIGDDAAVLRPTPQRQVVATTDIQIEGVHFKLSYATPYDVGWKAMAVNLSDIAAMGGTPRHAVVSLALRPDLNLQWIEDLYRGLREISAAFGVSIVGGNLARSLGSIVIDVTLLGEVEENLIVRRIGARAGDRILVTGTLGASAAGREVLERGLERNRDLVQAHLRPQPRVHEGRLVARSRWATAMIDLSDGLATDVWRLCDANQLGVRVDADTLPVSPATRAVAAEVGRSALELALFGGEDYELLIAAGPTHVEALTKRMREEVGTPVTTIGEFVDRGKGRLIVDRSQQTELQPRGWDHFSSTGW